MTQYQLLVTLAGRIIQAAQQCLNHALRHKQLGSAEANVLMFLYTNGDGIRQETIVLGVDVTKPAVSRTITSLERKGYIRREQNAKDKRSYIVWLTEKARKEESFIQKQFADLVAAARVGISDDKVAEFIEIFEQVANNLEAHRKACLGK